MPKAASARALAHAMFAVTGLVQMERRSVQHTQDLRTGAGGSLGRLFEPGVFADQQANPQALHLNHQRRQPRVAARHEIATLVEHLVVGQLTLAVGALHAPIHQH